jgi:glycosyltransferase involved in cell wall biosynthesis
VIALLHPVRGQGGAVERYVEQIEGALRDRGVLVDADGGTPMRDLVRVLRRLRPSVVHVMDVWPQAVLAARIARVPRVLVTHHTPELPRRDNLAGRAWQRLGWLARPEVIYTSEADRARDGRRPSHVVALGIDLDRFDSASPALPAGDRHIVGNVARLAPQKDHRTLVEAARLVPEADFVVAGDGELRAELERLAEDTRVRFLGMRDDVPELLASFDVFAFPSLFEGLCLAVIEAQAAGVPVVATPVGGIRETVVDGETGLLVPTGDPRALAAAIRRLLDDRPAAEAMAAEAKRRVRARFSIERMVDETLRVYGLRA